jgi:hypothetical protein
MTNKNAIAGCGGFIIQVEDLPGKYVQLEKGKAGFTTTNDATQATRFPSVAAALQASEETHASIYGTTVKAFNPSM